MNQYRILRRTLFYCSLLLLLNSVQCHNRTSITSLDEEYDPDYDDPKYQRALTPQQRATFDATKSSEALRPVGALNDSVLTDQERNGTTEECWVCTQWLPINHYTFQLANIFLLLSYFAKNSLNGLLYLRLVLAIGSFFFTFWAMTVICAFDTFLWNAVFTVINAVHFVVVLYSMRPVKIISELDQVYKIMFEPLKISKIQFKKVVDCMKLIRHLQPHESFAREGETQVDTLSLLLEGKCVASQQGRVLHVINAHQFVDSAEWFGVLSDTCSQVTVTALEESKVLMWQKDKLKLTLTSDPHFQAVFNHILGQDVVQKLIMAHGVLSLTSSIPHDEQEYYAGKNLMLTKENLSLIAQLQQMSSNEVVDNESSSLLGNGMSKHSDIELAHLKSSDVESGRSSTAKGEWSRKASQT